ncbi:MAG: hypothetical protein COB24_11510 [Hyphomicrobiales bacterium]|nr:MAG: hypothetical protein COB24_11510 [Hyphomicrobiales bacterium]
MKNIILWIILASVWGSSYLAIKIAVESISPLTLVAMRMSTGTIILLVILRAQSLSLPRDLASWKVLTVSGLFGSIIPFSLISFGELHVESGLAALLMGIAPVVTILLAPLAHKDEKLTKNSLIGIGFGIVGLLVLFGPVVLNGIGSHIMGQLAVLGAALCYAFTTLYVRKYASLPAVTMSAGSMLIGTIIIVVAALSLDPPLLSNLPNLHSLTAAVYLGIFPTALATWIYFYLVPQLGAARMSQINFMVPVVGALLGIVFLNEALGVNAFIALALILLAIYYVSVKTKYS